MHVWFYLIYLLEEVICSGMEYFVKIRDDYRNRKVQPGTAGGASNPIAYGLHFVRRYQIPPFTQSHWLA